MLSSELNNTKAKQGTLASYNENYSEIDFLNDKSLDKAIEAMENEVINYRNAGLTQVSTWLD